MIADERTKAVEAFALGPGEQIQGFLNGCAAQGQQVADAAQLAALLPVRPPRAIVRAFQRHRGNALRGNTLNCMATWQTHHEWRLHCTTKITPYLQKCALVFMRARPPL